MDIKILTSYHKKCALISSDIIKPIQVGTDINGCIYPEYLHDNTGDNISAKNRMYCELTAQYWAWKNLDADYYGFMHYRRYFSLNTAILDEDQYGNVMFDSPNEICIEKLHLSDSEIRATVSQYDLICTEPQIVSNLGSCSSVYEQYKKSSHHRIEDLDTVLNIITEKYPQFIQAARKYINGDKGYYCNMYIMKKELFHDYSNWLFDILAEHEKRSDFRNYDIDEYRVSGFLGERLWGIYYTWLKENKQLRIIEVQRSFFANTGENVNFDILPAFSENNIPVVLSADNKYVPYVATLLKSIMGNANSAKNYDFVILNTNISEENKNRLRNEYKGNTNLSIRFFDVSHLFNSYTLYTHSHFTVEIYFRLLMQDIMRNYDKVIYLDSDMIILDDVSKLYDVSLGDNYLAAVKDVDSAGCFNGIDPNRKEYHDKYLKLADPYAYFNSGVLVFNLSEIRKNISTSQVMDLAVSQSWLFPDQDVLNMLCAGKVSYLDMSWNVMMNWKDASSCRMDTARRAPHWLFSAYTESRKAPKIVHYAGFQKPWSYPDCDFAEHFWKYARETSFYEEIVAHASADAALHSQKADRQSVDTSAAIHQNGYSRSWRGHSIAWYIKKCVKSLVPYGVLRVWQRLRYGF